MAGRPHIEVPRRPCGWCSCEGSRICSIQNAVRRAAETGVRVLLNPESAEWIPIEKDLGETVRDEEVEAVEFLEELMGDISVYLG